MNGLLVLDKPSGMTSRAAVNEVQSLLPPGAKVGHTGTLDPMATGVLVLCIGQATRLAEYIQGMEKVYQASIRLGARSYTDDAEGPIHWSKEVLPIEGAQVESVLGEFVGTIQQRPPHFSAVKVSGRRSYEHARKGKESDLAYRTVTIHEIKLLGYEFPVVEVEIRCGKGTYIRALARDIGEKLGCGAFLASLRRLRVGDFRVEEAAALDWPKERLLAGLLPLERAVAMLPRLPLDEDALLHFRHGQRMPADRVTEGEFAVFDVRGGLAGVGSIQDGLLQPTIVLST